MSEVSAVQDPARLRALQLAAVLDTPAEDRFDRFTRLASRLLDVPVSLVSLVDHDRQYFKSCLGLPEPWASARETPLSHSFCQHVVQSAEPLVVEDARENALVRDNLAIRDLHVIAYAGVPLTTSDGFVLGSLCAIDDKPRTWSAGDIGALRDLAGAVMTEIELERKVEHRTVALREALEAAGAADRLRTARDEAEAANRAKSEFLSRMSHELRTPLNAILGFGQLLEMDAADPDTAESVEQILRAGRHLLALVDEVLDLARIEAGHMSIPLEPVAVRDVVRESLDLVRHMAAGHGVTIEAAAAVETPYAAAANAQRLKQVLINLLNNAIKYNRRGGTVTLTCEPTAGGRLCIAVRDTGRGIPAARLAQLFTPFERLEAEGGAVQGTGLGLALSRGLVEAMGGRIGVESTEGEGSRFRVEIPMAAGPQEDPEPRDAPQEETAPAACGTRTVLVVEDNSWNVRLLERLFTRRPELRLRVASTGSRGLELAREHRPELILLDPELPDLAGEEVLQRLRDDPALRGIPVLMLAGEAVPARAERLTQLGVRGYVTRPYVLETLLAALDEHLASR